MSKATSRITIPALIACFASLLGHAAVLHVPGNYASIQSAIDQSQNGDVILVNPGIYLERINFKGKAISITSTNAADPTVVASTIIRAPGPGSVVTFASGETTNAVLAGFTITGGSGTTNTEFGPTIYWGGGVYCYGASPTILGNIITANALPMGDASTAGYGCGIACILSDAVIARNTLTANTGYAGGGIMTYVGRPRVVSNVIYSNSVGVGGGAVLISGGQLINNTVVGNYAELAGNIYAASDATYQCVLSDNIVCSATGGGGIYLDSQGAFTQLAFNDVWGNAGSNYVGVVDRTGVSGNLSQDPQFLDAARNDFHLTEVSPCINAGDPQVHPAAGEVDFYGRVRLYAGRVDIGAAEYSDNFSPIADAGADQVVQVAALPASITLDGTASSDPNGAAISYHWRQISGPAGTLTAANTAKPVFYASALGTYVFELIVNNGGFNSFADPVQVIVKNEPPTADAGDDRIYSELEPITTITLDGSRSSDPEGMGLSYRWRQISGWKVQLSNATAVSPTFMRPWPGSYRFELVVNDGLQDSKPAYVAIVIGTNHPPVADAGSSRFVCSNAVTLDGTRSYDPDGIGRLTYSWRQASGPVVKITGTNTATPVVSGFIPKGTLQQCLFELVVSDGTLTSSPSRVIVNVVPDFGANALQLVNPPFDPARPTIVAFGGGNCSTGGGLTFGGAWQAGANWITVNSYGPAYAKYGNMLVVYLSSVAPDYKQPIQTIGFSTGNLPAMEVGRYVNLTYKDARYAVNRVSLLDAVCSDLSASVTQFHANRIDGEQCWVDNYISNDPNYARRPILPGALNVVCNPARAHSYPYQRYAASSFLYTNGGLTAFAYLSLLGDGKNYQLSTPSQKYYFVINSAEAIVFYNQSTYPGKVLAPVKLQGPADGATIGPGGATLGCEPVGNAVRYQLLFGVDPNRVAGYSVITDTTNPPQRTVTGLPQAQTWWTVKAYDQYGSTIYADPRLLNLPENKAPVADAGPDQVVYAGLDGTARVTLSGSKSADPDGDTLAYTWAWAMGATLHESTGVSLSLNLPIGVHTFQLMVSDGHVDSDPDEVRITVVEPLECEMKVTPSTINLRSSGSHITARVRFPEGFAAAEVDRSKPLLIYPGGIPAVGQRSAVGNPDQQSLTALFDRAALAGEVTKGTAELTLVGTLRSGRLFYGRDTVRVVGNSKAK